MKLDVFIAHGTGCLDPSGLFSDPQHVTVDVSEVVRFGKVKLYGSKSPRFVVQLRDGSKGATVAMSKQPDPDAARWIKKTAGQVRRPRYPATEMYSVNWIDLPAEVQA
jgi:hypothetical protein